MFGRWLTGGVAVGVFVVGSLCVGCSAKEPQGRITTVTVTAEPQAPEAEPTPDDPRPWASAVAGAAGPIRDAVFAAHRTSGRGRGSSPPATRSIRSL